MLKNRNNSLIGFVIHIKVKIIAKPLRPEANLIRRKGKTLYLKQLTSREK